VSAVYLVDQVHLVLMVLLVLQDQKVVVESKVFLVLPDPKVVKDLRVQLVNADLRDQLAHPFVESPVLWVTLDPVVHLVTERMAEMVNVVNPVPVVALDPLAHKDLLVHLVFAIHLNAIPSSPAT